MNFTRISFIIAISVILYTTSAQSQIITTIAGNGSGGYSGDGGLASLASINQPQGVYADALGNVFIADQYNSRVRKVAPSGIITTIAGTGISGHTGDGLPATDAEIGFPNCVTSDAAGNVYVLDYYGYVRKINTAGIISTYAGTGSTSFSGDGGPATDAGISDAYGIWLDEAGNMYICDFYNNRVRKINTLGIINTIAGTGVAGYSGDGGAATNAQLNWPTGVVTDPSGNVYISDEVNNAVRKINTLGIISTIAGTGAAGFSGDGGPATAVLFNSPYGLFRDCPGNIYVSDANNNRIRKINTSGIVTTVCGTGTASFGGDGGPAIAAMLQWPEGTSYDGQGNAYICDKMNQRIRKISTIIPVPSFTAGLFQNLTLCQNDPATAINSLLTVNDTAMGESDTWSLLTPPAHGSVTGTYTTTATGSMLTPSGITYAVTSGYNGHDTFKVVVRNCKSADTITIYVTVIPLPNAGIISGTDSVCQGHTTPLTESVTGGIWSSSMPSIATISTSGVVTGVTAGMDTVFYTVTVDGCSAKAAFPMKVRSHSACILGLTTNHTAGTQTANIIPNPSNGKISVLLNSDFDETMQIVVSDVIGQKVLQANGQTNVPLNIGIEIPGIYVLNAITEHGRTISQVVVK